MIFYQMNKFVTAFLCQDHQPIHGGRFMIKQRIEIIVIEISKCLA